MKNYTRSILVIIAYIATLIVNSLATTLPLFGRTTGGVSDSFNVFFVPANYVFAIWGVIYLLLGGYVVWQALPKQRENKVLDSIGMLFILSSIANTVWLFFWHAYQILFTLPVMLILLGTLIIIYKRVQVSPYDLKDWQTNLFLRIPFSVYVGWISVATIANATVFLDYLGVKSLVFTGQAWAAILIIVAGGLATALLHLKKDVFYSLVIIWAVLGIRAKFPEIDVISYASLFITGFLFVFGAVKVLEKTN